MWIICLLVFNNSVILQWGYAQNVAPGQAVYFPITHTTYARCCVNLINEGYAFINTSKITNSYFIPNAHMTNYAAMYAYVIWMSIGY